MEQAPGVPLQNIESIIIQMALQTSKAQGKAITGQTIFDVANQIIRNPNGILTQVIIQLAKQDTHDSGKTGQTVNVIKKVVEVRNGERDSNGGGGNNCFQRGYRDGEDHPFNQGTYNDCGDKYYKGFIQGCTSVKGNDREVCETATDVGGTVGAKLPLCDGSFQKCRTPTGHVCEAGSTAHECEIDEPEPVTPTRSLATTQPPVLGTDPILNFIKEVAKEYSRSIMGPAGPPLVEGLAQLMGDSLANDLVLRTANNVEQPQAVQALTNLQEDIQSNPDLSQRLGQLRQLYETNDVSAVQASDLLANKIASGTDPARAIQETSIPEPTNAGTETSTSTAAFGGSPFPGIIPSSNVEATAAVAGATDPNLDPVAAGTESTSPLSDGTVPAEGVGVQAAAGTDPAAAAGDTSETAAAVGDTTTSVGTPSGEDTDTEDDSEEEFESGDEDEAEASSDDEAEEESGGEDEGGGDGNGDGGDGGGDGGGGDGGGNGGDSGG